MTIAKESGHLEQLSKKINKYINLIRLQTCKYSFLFCLKNLQGSRKVKKKNSIDPIQNSILS